jgi:hypothetical protein
MTKDQYQRAVANYCDALIRIDRDNPAHDLVAIRAAAAKGTARWSAERIAEITGFPVALVEQQFGAHVFAVSRQQLEPEGTVLQ